MADSSMNSSDDVLKQISEQTSGLEEGTGEPEYIEQEEPTEEIVEEEELGQPEETGEPETPPEPETEPEKEPLYKVKANGEEREYTLDQLKKLASMGVDYNKKMHEIKEQKQKSTPNQPMDWDKFNKVFVDELQANPGQTMGEFVKTVFTSLKQEEMEQRKMDKAIEKELSGSLDNWGDIKDAYRDYRDEGYDPQTALMYADRDFWKSVALRTKERGLAEGEKKAILKQKASIPSGNKKGSTPTDMPDLKDMKNMTSDQILKAAFGGKIVRNPNW